MNFAKGWTCMIQRLRSCLVKSNWFHLFDIQIWCLSPAWMFRFFTEDPGPNWWCFLHIKVNGVLGFAEWWDALWRSYSLFGFGWWFLLHRLPLASVRSAEEMFRFRWHEHQLVVVISTMCREYIPADLIWFFSGGCHPEKKHGKMTIITEHHTQKTPNRAPQSWGDLHLQPGIFHMTWRYVTTESFPLILFWGIDIFPYTPED